MVIECFVDESNMHDARIYFVGVLAVRSEKIDNLVADLDKIRKYVVAITGDANAELHGQQIYQGSGSYHGLMPHERVHILDQIAQAIRLHSARLVVKPYDYSKASPFTRHPPHLYAMAWSLEHIQKFFQCPWSVAADDHSPTLNERVSRALDLCRTSAHNSLNCCQFKHLSKTSPIFLRSHESLLIQACDVALYLVARNKVNKMIPGRNAKASKVVEDICKNFQVILLLKSVWP